MKEHVILTASDRKYGDFLIEHWYKSLRENTSLDKLDIAVMDYGLSAAQRYYLKNHQIIVQPCKRDGHVTVIRFRDYYTFLSAHAYDQVLICDSGDIIFQQDISHLFESDKSAYRAVCEENKSPFSLFIRTEYFSKNDAHELLKQFLKHRMINAGLVLGPRLKMKYLCRQCVERIVVKDKFGPDQVLINALLHEKGFIELPVSYNFVIATSNQTVDVREGKIYFESGELVPVVHNAGNLKILRPIKNFGYGREHNTIKYPVYKTIKAVTTASNNIYELGKRVMY